MDELVVLDTHEKLRVLNEFYQTERSLVELENYQQRNSIQRTYDPFFHHHRVYIDTLTMNATYETLNTYNCHLGQLKLFYAFLEFICIAHSKGILENSLLVYIGSAPGFNIYTVLQMIQGVNTHLVLYDPATFDKRLFGRNDVSVFTGNDGFWTLDCVPTVLDLQRKLNKKHLLFISDIRIDPDEESIMRDNLLNLQSILRLRPAMYQVKMRVPYYQEKHPITVSFADKLTDEDIHSISGKRWLKDIPNTYVYLDGDIFYQLYAPPHSAETRLIGFPTEGGLYKLCRYDNREYESNLFHFNVTRNFFEYRNLEHPYKKIVDYCVRQKLFPNIVYKYEHVCEILLIIFYLSLFESFDTIPTLRDQFACIKDTVHFIYKSIPDMYRRKQDCMRTTYLKNKTKNRKGKLLGSS